MWDSSTGLGEGPGGGVRDQSHVVAWGSPLPCPRTGDMVRGVVLGPVIEALAVAKAKLYQTVGGTVRGLKGHGHTLPKHTEHHGWVAAGEGAQQGQALLGVWEDPPQLHRQIST